ncbi:MAG: transcription antitermination factor NusB [Rhodobacterales bacterium]|jgi:N utilization substance protein B|nr:transcription antitermination factor NusB [Paracoccaceae bacterium]NCW05779.1 transcription antitermination factor NusB [Rhodobacterales bacterium]NCX54399.1 transcription antitermination factor NusB [Rhodobacterales bacterium]NCX57937.1 transcription antitermination factor NusB [Paracoccaceae bacterium]|tara:strand:+ start:303 stop:785 length:483 start_codon:yes stop_codon:yes gene_type:complete
MSQSEQVSGNEKRKIRSTTRLYAIQALFQMEQLGLSTDEVVEEFVVHRFGEEYEEGQLSDGDEALFKSIVESAVNYQAYIDQLTDRALVKKWPIARIDPTLRSLFRAAAAEITQIKTPPKIVITEYVALAHAFFTDGKEPNFVNAVLDHMAREACPTEFS